MTGEYYLSCSVCGFEQTITVEDVHSVFEREARHRASTSDAHVVEFERLD